MPKNLKTIEDVLADEEVTLAIDSYNFEELLDLVPDIKLKQAIYRLLKQSDIDMLEYIKTIPCQLFFDSDLGVSRIPANIEKIEEYAFRNNKHLKDLVIPETVKEIKQSAFAASSLERVELSTTTYEECFRGCRQLKEAILHNGVTTITSSMFNKCTSLESVSIPETVTHICSCAFAECYSLDTLFVPRSVTRIDADAFSGCKGLHVFFEVEEEPAGYIIPSYITTTFGAKSSRVTNTRIRVGDIKYRLRQDGTASVIGFYGTNIHVPESIYSGTTKYNVVEVERAVNNEKVNTLFLDKNVEKIGHEAFMNCTKLTEVTVASKHIEIDGYAFAFCSLHTFNVSEPCSISVGNSAFTDSSLTTTNIWSNLVHVGKLGFADCNNLVIDELDLTNVTCGNSAFSHIKKIRTLRCGEYLSNSQFAETLIDNLILNKGCEMISEDAFRGCGLNTLTIPKTVKVIRQNAFSDNTSLKQINFTGVTYQYASVLGTNSAFMHVPARMIKCADGACALR